MSDLYLDVDLPFSQGRADLIAALKSHGGAVIQAPPGTGKTTLAPGYVADFLARTGQAAHTGQVGHIDHFHSAEHTQHPDQAGQSSQTRRVIVTQPRRVAARSSAARLNELYGWPIAGHTVRGESTVKPETLIEFLTPGVLLRRLLRAPDLEGVGAVILDEIHERQLESDLVFAMVSQLRELRDDLYVVAMSATVDARKFADLLKTPIVDVLSPIHPLQFHYAPATASITRRDHRARPGQPGSIEAIVAQTILHALREQPDSADILAFVPTIRGTEIVADMIAACTANGADGSSHPVDALALHGGLTPTQQQLVINPPTRSESPIPRRVIIATDVAESSLTVPGVSIVVDSCLSRVNRRDSSRGMSVLVTELTSQASATQRAGRAGRLGPGVVYRCITAEEYGKLPSFSPPAIQTSDLTGALLDCACWGSPGGTDLPLPDPFPTVAATQATQSLVMLGAITGVSESTPYGTVTDLGEALASLPMDPHLARGGLVALRAVEDATPAHSPTDSHTATSHTAASHSATSTHSPADSHTAASRSATSTHSPTDSHTAASLILKTLAILDSSNRLPDDIGHAARTLGNNHPEFTRIRSLFRRALPQYTPAQPTTATHPFTPADPVAFTIACAFPHLIARRVPGSEHSVLTTSGTGALLPAALAQTPSDWFAIADISRAHTGDGTGARVRSGLPLTPGEVFAAGEGGVGIKEETTTTYDEATGRVRARTTKHFGAIQLSSTPAQPTTEQTRAAIDDALTAHGLRLVGLTTAAESLARRIQFLADAHVPGYPTLRGELPETVRAFVTDALVKGQKPDVVGLLRGVIPWDHPIDELAPEAIELPGGRRARVTYPPVEGSATEDAPAVIATKLQDCFGLEESPVIGNRRVQFHLLSPAQRPLAVTDDLASFWDGPYQDVRKDMRGRYPKHPWPEDPRKK
ncbi:ATP-dependent helicase C-terminal domain-containing protein [Corynebacterium auriscanis]|uniref:ATP-dependent helicase C-terminal domain-containing protein n=1 Tax=Corynebacterium auriscanis TaxID=99807 RepID=UPI003CF3A384